jgi:hypothetical protein
MVTISDRELIWQAQQQLTKRLIRNMKFESIATIGAVADSIDVTIFHGNKIWYGYTQVKG